MNHIMNSTESLHFHHLCISPPLKRHGTKELHMRCSFPEAERTPGVTLAISTHKQGSVSDFLTHLDLTSRGHRYSVPCIYIVPCLWYPADDTSDKHDAAPSGISPAIRPCKRFRSSRNTLLGPGAPSAGLSRAVPSVHALLSLPAQKKAPTSGTEASSQIQSSKHGHLSVAAWTRLLLRRLW